MVTARRIKTYLPESYDLVPGDTFQLFYRSVICAVNPYNYHIRIVCPVGNAYNRFFEFTPTDEQKGKEYTLTLELYDDCGKRLCLQKTVLKVAVLSFGSRQSNVLCLGDSLTAKGLWCMEGLRRLQELYAAAGKPSAPVKLIGTRQSDVPEHGWEGYGGWTWRSYVTDYTQSYGELGTFSNPLWEKKSQKTDFAYYCKKHGFGDIDYLYVMLTWNQLWPNAKEFAVNKFPIKHAMQLIDTFRQQFPQALVRVMGITVPSVLGGSGTIHGAGGGYSDAFGMFKTALVYNSTLKKVFSAAKYKDFVKYIDVMSQFDSENAYPQSDVQVNVRSNKTEKRDSDDVHPNIDGYNQIGDVFFRALCAEDFT